jgi:tetratricopeptide (TPR) repeat protein
VPRDRVAQHPLGEQAWYAIKLGDIARLEGDLHEAARQHERAAAIYDAQTGAEAQNAWRAWPHYKLGEDLMDLGRPADAIAPFETAARLWETLSGDADAADPWFELGRATFAAGDQARGRALVRRAQAAYAKYPKDTDPEMAAKASAWLAAHR